MKRFKSKIWVMISLVIFIILCGLPILYVKKNFSVSAQSERFLRDTAHKIDLNAKLRELILIHRAKK